MMQRQGYGIINGDITLVAQKPKIAPFFARIKEKLAALLKVHEDLINIKAVTTEGMGWVGEGRGMAATAVVLLQKRRKR
jgi:2-C-methyl-D-erythritol 2,4-cyclodiphosphate synthase